MASKKELIEQNKLREDGNRLIERANLLEERHVGLVAKLTEKIKESGDELKEGFENLGIADSIKDALNVSNKYVQAFSKKIIPGLFSSISSGGKIAFLSLNKAANKSSNFFKSLTVNARATGTNVKALFSSFTDGVSFNEKKVADLAAQLEALKVSNEAEWGLKGGARFLMTPDELTEMDASYAKQESLIKELADAKQHLADVKLQPTLFSKDTLKTTAMLKGELDEINEKLKNSKNDKNQFNPGFNPTIIKNLERDQIKLQNRIEKRASRSSGKMGNAVKSGMKKAAIGTMLFAGGLVVGILGLIGKVFTMGFERLSEVQNAVIDIRKQFGFSESSVSQFSKYIDESRGRMLALGLSSAEVAANIGGMVSTLGESRNITNDEIELVNQLNARLGTSSEVASGVLDVFQLFGPETQKQSAIAVTSLVAMASAAGMGFNTIAGDLSENAEQILTTFNGYDIELANAAIQARLLGLDIGRVGSVAEGLLDFESSITSEMKAEVLLGRQLNLSRLRRAAFAGDEEEMVRGIADLTREIGSLDGMNYFQKKALAEATGLSVVELQKSFKLQTELGKLTEAERKQYATLTDQQKEMVGTNAIDMQQGLQRVKAMEPLLASVAKLKAKWNDIKDVIAGPMSKVIGMVTDKFTEVLARIKEQVDGGQLTAAFVRFGKIVTQVMDNIVDADFIESVTNFINKGIEWIKKIVTAAGDFFGNMSGLGMRGTVSQNPNLEADASVNRETVSQNPNLQADASVNDGVIQSGKVISTHPEDFIIATKKPQELMKDTVVVKQDFPPELMKMIQKNNELLNSLLVNGIDARVDKKQVNRAVFASNNVR